MMADNPAPRRCVVLWNAEAYDARAHVNPDGVATFLNAHLGLERDTKCIVFAGNRSAAATKLAFWSLEVQGQEQGVIHTEPVVGRGRRGGSAAGAGLAERGALGLAHGGASGR